MIFPFQIPLVQLQPNRVDYKIYFLNTRKESIVPFDLNKKMTSEFEKALLAINCMTYDEKMEYARLLRINHELLEGHDANTCAFCIGSYPGTDVCSLCFTMYEPKTLRRSEKCTECGINLKLCSSCQFTSHDGKSCPSWRCVGCLSRMDKVVCCSVCNKDFKNPASKREPHSMGYSYKELMTIATKIKQDHEFSSLHNTFECEFCFGTYSDQEICIGCFKSIVYNNLALYEEPTDYSIMFQCIGCNTYHYYCKTCEQSLTCKKCVDMTDRHVIGKYYCRHCLNDMPPEPICKCHDVSFNNPFSAGMTKPCKRVK